MIVDEIAWYLEVYVVEGNVKPLTSNTKYHHQITAEFTKVQNEYYNSLIVEMREDCETYKKATE